MTYDEFLFVKQGDTVYANCDRTKAGGAPLLTKGRGYAVHNTDVGLKAVEIVPDGFVRRKCLYGYALFDISQTLQNNAVPVVAPHPSTQKWPTTPGGMGFLDCSHAQQNGLDVMAREERAIIDTQTKHYWRYLSKDKVYTPVAIFTNAQEIQVVDDQGFSYTWPASYFEEVVNAATTAPQPKQAIGIPNNLHQPPQGMCKSDFDHLQPGDAVYAIADHMLSGFQRLTKGNKYSVIDTDTSTQMILVECDDSLNLLGISHNRVWLDYTLFSCWQQPQYSPSNPPPAHTLNVVPMDEEEKADDILGQAEWKVDPDAEPACYCPSPQVHEANCLWKKWNDKRKEQHAKA